MDKSTVPEAIGIGGLIVSIATLTVFAIQIKLLRNGIRRAEQTFTVEQARVRSHATLEFMTATMERRHVLLSEVPDGSNMEEVAQLLRNAESSEAQRRTLHHYLSFYETLAVGVNTGVLEIDIVDRAWESIIIRTFTSYSPYIRARRALLSQPTLFVELEQLAATLQQRRATKSGAVDRART